MTEESETPDTPELEVLNKIERHLWEQNRLLENQIEVSDSINSWLKFLAFPLVLALILGVIFGLNSLEFLFTS